MAEKGAKQIERTREGVPCWDGDPTTFQEFTEVSLHWVEAVPFHKRYLCGPKLQAELQGTVKRFVLSQKPGWISRDQGVQTLLDLLRKHLGQPQLTEMSDYMARYFRQSRRRKHESMNDYITRKSEIYNRACQALRRVEGRYAHKPRSNQRMSQPSRGTSQPSEEQYQSADEAEEELPPTTANMDAGSQQAGSQQESSNQPVISSTSDPWSNWHRQDWWSSWDYGWGRDRDWSHGAWQSASTSYEPVETYQDLLPPYVQGWFLLQDAGLEPQERIMVMSALKDNFHVDRVSQELRNQWSDEDLRRKDQSDRGSAWSAEPQEEDDPWLQGDKSSPDLSLLVGDGLSEEGVMMINEAEDEAQQALMMMDRGRRTLREARAKQNYVKKSRQFYRSESSYKPSFRQGQPTGRQEPSDPGTRCLSCGGTGHKTSMCPKKGNASTATTEESAPFVCYTETRGQDQAYVTGGGITTREAMEQGKAIIDGGAARTLGSVTAIESVMGLNQQSHGEDGLKLDPSERPVFGFGNSSSDQCLSTAWLKVQAAGKEGELKIHTLDKGSGPVLFSIETLRSLGALIDFENDLAVFKKISSTQVIPLERSCTGHQLIPLTEDWYRKAHHVSQAVPSLKDYI